MGTEIAAKTKSAGPGLSNSSSRRLDGIKEEARDCLTKAVR